MVWGFEQKGLYDAVREQSQFFNNGLGTYPVEKLHIYSRLHPGPFTESEW